MKKGFTLVETLVGIFLILIVFTGIFGGFQLGLKIVGQAKAKVTALSLANEKIEIIRNLPYAQIGLLSGYPLGEISPLQDISRNNIVYTIATQIDYVIDTYDGLALPEDACPNDYKKIKIKVSWPGFLAGEIAFDTLVSPKNLVQECEEKGGVLKVSVFDSQGENVAFPDIEVVNINTGLTKTSHPANGVFYFVLPPDEDAYKITVSKDGYSTDRTYGAGENYQGKIIASPENPHVTLIEGGLIETGFSIDRLASLTVKTYTEGGVSNFLDSFWDETKVAESANVVFSDGEITLAQSNGQYSPEGYIISETIEPYGLNAWHEFDYTEDTPPQTKIRHQVLYFNGSSWVLVPNQDLPGNSAGLAPPPIDLKRLDPLEYPKIRLKATLISNSSSKTPVLFDWQATWLTADPNIVGSAKFTLQGGKIVGHDDKENLIYKYLADHETDGTGVLAMPDLEWDVYKFSVDKVLTGLDLVRTDPLQPLSVLPLTNGEIKLFLKAENTLLVMVIDEENGDPVFSANARVFKQSLNYDKTQPTDEYGRTFFMPLSATTYGLEVRADGYQDFSIELPVSGTTIKIIPLTSAIAGPG